MYIAYYYYVSIYFRAHYSALLVGRSRYEGNANLSENEDVANATGDKTVLHAYYAESINSNAYYK